MASFGYKYGEEFKNARQEAIQEWNKQYEQALENHKKTVLEIGEADEEDRKYFRSLEILERIVKLVITIVQLVIGFELIHMSNWITNSTDVHWYDLLEFIAGVLVIIVAISNVIMLRIKTYFEKEYHH